MTDKLMEQIEEIQREIDAKERLLVQVKNEWLLKRGWTIENRESFLSPYRYEKDGFYFIFVDEAIEREQETSS